MNDRKIKLIALDLDDTTLRSDGTLADETKSAIQRAIREGIEIVVASGRAYSALPAEVIDIPGTKYAVTTNGAAINQIPGGKRIVSYSLPQEAVLEILNIAEPYSDIAAVEAFIDGVAYTSAEHVAHPENYGCKPAYVEYVRNTRKSEEDIYGFIRNCGKDIDSMDIACADEKCREIMRKQILENISGIHMTSSVRHLTEVINELAGKDSGLRYICEKLGISHENVVACGNADNDIAMMKFAGLGVAVSNSSKNCLDAADLIVGSSNEDSIAKLINKICDGEEF